jgi:hypothetical protein
MSSSVWCETIRTGRPADTLIDDAVSSLESLLNRCLEAGQLREALAALESGPGGAPDIAGFPHAAGADHLVYLPPPQGEMPGRALAVRSRPCS